MKTSKHNVRPLQKVLSAGARGKGAPVFNLACALAIAEFIFCGNPASAANALINPGAETGDLTGWTVFNSGSVISTNSLEYNHGNSTGASNIMSYSGAWDFKTYNTAGSHTLIYQDLAAAAGSEWSASVYAHSHAQDYISVGSTAHMQVVFYDDTGTNALAVYGSDILDPADAGFPFTIVPPPATNASGWLFLQATNHYTSDPASEANWDQGGSPVATNLTAPDGTAFVRFQLEFDGGYNGGSVFWDDCDLEKVVESDPDVITPPSAQTVVAGQTATFTVAGNGSSALSYQWQNGTNALVNDSRISGATSNTLTIVNSKMSDAGNYSVIITDSNGSIRSVPVALTVISPLAAANALGMNSGFENAPNWSPWHPFGGYGLYSTNNVYYGTSDHVNVYDGNWMAHLYRASTDNGFYYSDTISAPPGSVWKGSGYAYITSGPDNLSSSNSCRLQVWFKNSGGSRIGPVYESTKIWGLAYTNTYPVFPRDTWVYLPITNVVDSTDTPTNFVQNFVAPPGSATIQYQVYYNGNGPTGGSVFWDDMALYQLLPVTNLSASVSGSGVSLSFSTRASSVYSVLYKTNLNDSYWLLLTNGIVGDGYSTTVTDPMTGQTRFYTVMTH